MSACTQTRPSQGLGLLQLPKTSSGHLTATPATPRCLLGRWESGAGTEEQANMSSKSQRNNDSDWPLSRSHWGFLGSWFVNTLGLDWDVGQGRAFPPDLPGSPRPDLSKKNAPISGARISRLSALQPACRSCMERPRSHHGHTPANSIKKHVPPDCEHAARIGVLLEDLYPHIG